MKITISKQELHEALQHVSKAISGRATVPILTGVKLDVFRTEGVKLTASDIDTTIRAEIPAEDGAVTVYESGSVVLPAKFFVEIIKKLPKETVDIEVGPNFKTIITSGKTKLDLVGMDPEEFPATPIGDEDPTLSLQGDELKELIRSTAFAVSTNETSPILTGVLWELSAGRLQLTATDRHRLARVAINSGADEEISFRNIVIAARTLNDLAKIISDDKEVQISVGTSQVLFRAGRVNFFSRVLDGNYPDTSKIIPTTFQSELEVSAKAFADSIDRAHLLAREVRTNIVRLEVDAEGAVRIESTSDGVGKVVEQIDADKFTGDPIKISFNSKYMLDALKATDSDHLHIGFTGPMSPIIIRPQGGGSSDKLNLILPYRTSV